VARPRGLQESPPATNLASLEMEADLGKLFAPSGFVFLEFCPNMGAQSLPGSLLPDTGLAVLQHCADLIGQLPRFSEIDRPLSAVLPVRQAKVWSEPTPTVRPPSLDDSALPRQQTPVAEQELADALVLSLSFLVNRITIFQNYSPSAGSGSSVDGSMG
jgi:hypothetical protein